MVNIMIGESARKLLSKVPLSDNTSSSRIQHIAEDINDKLIEKVERNELGLQLDEATDNNNGAHLICYVLLLLRLKTCSRSLILLYPKTVWSGLSALVPVLMVLVPCPAVMEDCRLLFEEKPLKHCVPTALFAGKHSRQNI
jgi:hypothetical protein